MLTLHVVCDFIKLEGD